MEVGGKLAQENNTKYRASLNVIFFLLSSFSPTRTSEGVFSHVCWAYCFMSTGFAIHSPLLPFQPERGASGAGCLEAQFALVCLSDMYTERSLRFVESHHIRQAQQFHCHLALLL